MKPTFFDSPEDFRAWLEQNHDSAHELIVGLHKISSGKPSITLREAQDEGLCFGWIDGKARNIDESRWAIRFTPRRSNSVWSAVNIKRAQALMAAGRITPAGLAAFEKRDEKHAKQYSYEREKPQFDSESGETFQANDAAWEFFCAQPPSYQRLNTWWVMSAKRADTREKRLAVLIKMSAEGRRIDPMKSPFEQANTRA